MYTPGKEWLRTKQWWKRLTRATFTTLLSTPACAPTPHLHTTTDLVSDVLCLFAYYCNFKKMESPIFCMIYLILQKLLSDPSMDLNAGSQGRYMFNTFFLSHLFYKVTILLPTRRNVLFLHILTSTWNGGFFFSLNFSHSDGCVESPCNFNLHCSHDEACGSSAYIHATILLCEAFVIRATNDTLWTRLMPILHGNDRAISHCLHWESWIYWQ